MKRENGKQFTRSEPRRLAEFAPQASSAAGIAGRLPRGVILHPTDYSEASRQAFELACRLARDSGSRLVVMHVAEPVRVSSLGMATPPPLPEGYRGAGESRLRLIQPRDPAVPVEHRLEEGDVAAAILRVACEAQADLIVMAGRERNWLGRLLMASVTERVERQAPRPVLRLNAQRPGKAAEAAWGNSSASVRPDCHGRAGADGRRVVQVGRCGAGDGWNGSLPGDRLDGAPAASACRPAPTTIQSHALMT